MQPIQLTYIVQYVFIAERFDEVAFRMFYALQLEETGQLPLP